MGFSTSWVQKKIRKWLLTAVPLERKSMIHEWGFLQPCMCELPSASKGRVHCSTFPSTTQTGHRLTLPWNNGVSSISCFSGDLGGQWHVTVAAKSLSQQKKLHYIGRIYKMIRQYTVATLVKNLSSAWRDNTWVCQVGQPLGCRQFLPGSGVRDHRSLLWNFFS